VKVINETPFVFASMMGKVLFPQNTITLIVKGTYALMPGTAALLPSSEQLPTTGDLFYDDDPHATVRYESDFAFFKPRADVLLVGHCHVPGGLTAGMCSVTFQAGPLSKTLVAFGDRAWRRNFLGYRSPTEPQPFTTMALRYEKSLGGPTYPQNPVGKGFRPDSNASGPSVHRLPNLEMLVGDRIAPSQTDGTPAGLGPLGRTWAQRMALVGEYAERWKHERWPWLPDDFDWAYFNAAPLDQQVNGFLKGDESLYFKNLHPVHSQWRAALPGTRVRCFSSERIQGRPRFREIKMELDTLWVDMDESRLVLVWRGLAVVASPDAKQIDELLIIQEPVQQVPRPVAEYELGLDNRKVDAEALAPVETPQESDQDDEAKDVHNIQDPQADAALTADLEQSMAQIYQSQVNLNLDPQVTAHLKTEKDPQRLAEKLMLALLKAADPESAEKVQARAQQTFKEHLARHRPEIQKMLVEIGASPALLDELDLNALIVGGPVPATPGAESMRDAAKRPASLRERDLTGADFSGLALPKADFRSARLAGARFTGARLAGADFSQAALDGSDFKGADLRGARFTAADLNAASFENAIMGGVDLCDAVLTQANLRDADLTDARLVRTQLGRADLCRCILRGADLEQADLSDANLTKADLTRARLAFTILESADLTLAVLRHSEAPSGAFNRTVLTQTDFSEACLEGCNFSDCRCDFAYFQSARLSRASFEGCSGRRVDFQMACLDAVRAGEKVCLPEARFRRATGKGANWAGADLKGADFFGSEMPFCDFSQADLSGCDAVIADMQQAIFDQAVLHGAKFDEANLFQARLEGADLRGASFRKCNLYGAEFLNATIDNRTILKSANLHGTKLEGMNR
jgi:uncharacterized protein YjbI with pentapeptide repeats